MSNVDSQASFDNIVIVVIGETSNKSAELKKFVQTFVLAKQPTGYFVLNDIFRYIKDESEEELVETTEQAEEQPVATETIEAAKVEEQEATPPSTSLDATAVDEKLQAVETEPAAEVAVNGINGHGESEEPAKHEEEAVTPEIAEKEVEAEMQQHEEKPQDPVPTPVMGKTTAATAPAPAQPAAPLKPMSWASRAAAANGSSAAKPVVPMATPKTAAPAAPKPTTSAPKAAAAASPAAPAPAAASQPKEPQAGSEWQSVGGDHNKRQNRPQSISGPTEKEGTMGYVRHVTEKVDAEELREALASHGEVVYFDVNRAKVCAMNVKPMTRLTWLELCICRVCQSRGLPGCRECQPTQHWWREHPRRTTPTQDQRLRWHWL